ncbi:DNA translocase FtsK [Dactylosporangium sp. NPDC005572]|uniref:DNA translocase FtsK n=1 Tax=Dactylosporangium sp. NPDC005572 TaxID=3156889 RepID=UPI0033B7C5DD
MGERVARWVDRAVERAARSLGLDDPGPPQASPVLAAVPPRAVPARPAATAPPAAAAVATAVLDGQGAVIAQVLADFGVDAMVTGSVTGPAVTTWRLRPGPGVKVEKIAGLTGNMAMELGTAHVRVVPVVDGEPGVMAVEVPAPQRTDVWLPALLGPLGDRHPLQVALGADTYGRPVLDNLARMLHLLIAGATGAGKSEFLNSLLCGLLSQATPAQLRLLLVDPKRVELIAYAGVPHLVTQIVTEPGPAVSALEWATAEMDRRYQLLAAAGVSHIDAYNAAAAAAGEEPLPYLVVVVDELADLMILARDDVETSIERLAQLARAAGIHLVLATQRPTVDVVTGRIKANLPSRLAFATVSATDSRTILDAGGAERLLGAGDGLYLGPGTSSLRRVQGPRVSAEHVRQVVAAARATGLAPTGMRVTLPALPARPAAADADGDELLERAEALVRWAGEGSVNRLRREFGVGHARASRLLDLLEQRGVVGPADGVNPRPVLPEEPAGTTE